VSYRTSAEVVLDSVTSYAEHQHFVGANDAAPTRLTSMYVVFPKMILGERNRHRGFSLSDRSSRAVPPEKLIAEVREDPAMPVKFRRRAKGMGGGEEMVGDELAEAQERWKAQAYRAAHAASWAAAAGEAKETVNRRLDPYIRMHSLMTATRYVWLNFFGLRLDEGADPTIQVLAQRCFEAYKDSVPKLLEPGEWHLPFVDYADRQHVTERALNESLPIPGDVTSVHRAEGVLEVALKVMKRLSAARCAHLSYNDLETGRRMTVDRALAIYDRLVNSRPLHASPCEHQATPDVWSDTYILDSGGDIDLGHWEYPEQHGNLYGWRQARKMLPGEAVAPLPEGYEL
jgi:thymidylate synthase ThyX